MDTPEEQGRKHGLIQLSSLTHVSAAALAILYGSGFLVVSVYLASFGIVQFELLRAKVLSAGILLCVFFAISSFEVSRVYGLLKPENSTSKSARVEDLDLATGYYIKVVLVFEYFVSSMVLAFFVGMFLEGFDFGGWKIGSYVCFIVLATLVLQTIQQQFPQKKAKCAILAALSIIVGLTGLIALRNWTLFTLALWFLFSGQMFIIGIDHIRNPQKFHMVNIHKWIINCIAIIAAFALFIYPKVRPSIGGGAPVAVQLQFGEKSLLDNSTKTQVWLVDENDKGFYILRGRSDKKAVFISRNLIAAVYYGE